jgi:hypothetical protein
MTTTRDGGMKITMTAKLIEVGGDDGRPCAVFQRLDGGMEVGSNGSTFKILTTVDEVRELASLLYRDLAITVSITPKR